MSWGPAAVFDDVIVGFENAVSQPIDAHELSNVLDRVEFWAPGRQQHECDVGRHDQLAVFFEADKVEPISRQLMTVPDVGPLTARAFRATVDRLERFRRSRDVGTHPGLTPRRYQSGVTDVQGRVSRAARMAKARVVIARKLAVILHRMWSDQTEFR